MRLSRLTVLATLATVLLAAPLVAEGQPAGRIHRIGALGTSDGPGWQAFRDGLQSLGYLEGRTITVDWRWAGNDAGSSTWNSPLTSMSFASVSTAVRAASPSPSARGMAIFSISTPLGGISPRGRSSSPLGF